MEPEELNEKMLRVWLRLSTDISNTRIVKNMSFNEALICNLLSEEEDTPLTATQLCARTHMLKSQMNRTLNAMEDKGLITRERSKKDRRQVEIRLSTQNRPLFEEEHRKNLRIVGTLLDRFGRERGEGLVEELEEVLNIVEEVLK